MPRPGPSTRRPGKGGILADFAPHPDRSPSREVAARHERASADPIRTDVLERGEQPPSRPRPGRRETAMRRSVIARRPLILGLLLAAVFAGGPSPASSQE